MMSELMRCPDIRNGKCECDEEECPHSIPHEELQDCFTDNPSYMLMCPNCISTPIPDFISKKEMTL